QPRAERAGALGLGGGPFTRQAVIGKRGDCGRQRVGFDGGERGDGGSRHTARARNAGEPRMATVHSKQAAAIADIVALDRRRNNTATRGRKAPYRFGHVSYYE